MILSASESHIKLDKLSRDSASMFFALSPEGFLLIKKGKSIEVCNFCLVLNGHYCRRNGLVIDTDLTLNDQGTFLCAFGKGKFSAPIGTDSCEYASSKKPLSNDFSLMLSMRFAARIILLIADGNFSSEALLVTLADTPSNALFADSILMKLAEARNPALVQKLFEEEVPDNGEEE